MTNIPLIVHLGDGCVIVGKLVTFEQTHGMKQLPKYSSRTKMATGL